MGASIVGALCPVYFLSKILANTTSSVNLSVSGITMKLLL